ncbi:hypothetical protein MMC30_001016 [Trapelia coarctata]|nr:hypothetical protein [Trapelia coarctata]
MVLKRKRSSSDSSPFSSSSNSYSSRDPSSSPTPSQMPQHMYHHSDTPMDGTSHDLHQIDNWTTSMHQFNDITPPHLHSRTRKRFRDSRPDEQTIHEHTYQKLFQAQRSPTQTVPALPRTVSASSTTSRRRSNAQQSLHEFWDIPDRSNSSRRAFFTAQPQPEQQLTCEDCDAGLGVCEDENATDTDMGGMGLALQESDYACRDCKRHVCDFCAVVVPGEGRECLQCRTSRKKWVGGIGWMHSAHI